MWPASARTQVSEACIDHEHLLALESVSAVDGDTLLPELREELEGIWEDASLQVRGTPVRMRVAPGGRETSYFSVDPNSGCDESDDGSEGGEGFVP